MGGLNQYEKFSGELKRILITGMSGTGKSTVAGGLAARGYRAIDTDLDGLSEVISVPEGELTGLGSGQDWVWCENRIQELLSRDDARFLFLCGCAPNQGTFYAQFDQIILLTAPADVIVERLASRDTNPFGKLPAEVARTLALKETIEPLLRRSAGCEIDTTEPLARVVDQILRFVGATQ